MKENNKNLRVSHIKVTSNTTNKHNSEQAVLVLLENGLGSAGTDVTGFIPETPGLGADVIGFVILASVFRVAFDKVSGKFTVTLENLFHYQTV